jgi:3-isopropylmalate dehydrogenase
MNVVNVDALCYHLTRDPGRYGVILTPNMFGDIVSDLLASLAGGLGTAAGANIGDGLSMFEPVHGSAPDIAGTGTSNPVAAILSASLMLEHLGELDAARAVEQAVADHLAESPRELLPAELGGRASTEASGDLIAGNIRKPQVKTR